MRAKVSFVQVKVQRPLLELTVASVYGSLFQVLS